MELRQVCSDRYIKQYKLSLKIMSFTCNGQEYRNKNLVMHSIWDQFQQLKAIIIVVPQIHSTIFQHFQFQKMCNSHSLQGATITEKQTIRHYLDSIKILVQKVIIVSEGPFKLVGVK